MAQVKTDEDAPAGFETLTFAGIGLLCEMLEPSRLSSSSDWRLLISELKHWGDVPDPTLVNIVSISEDDRGPIANLRAGSEWIVEFLPWGSDGMLRKRCTSAESVADAPCGGYTWNGDDLILLRKNNEASTDAGYEVSQALESGELSQAKALLYRCGSVLGSYHKGVESVRTTPPDPRRWNARLASIEENLRADSIWRAPHTRDTQSMLSLGDVRLLDIVGEKVRIGRPRLADALCEPNCQFPAIRDLSSLIHDLSREHYKHSSDLDIVELRLSLIEGWRSSAPKLWCSNRVFYSHRGGLAIWEYEQCLLDIIEAVSNQSGAPDPAVSLIRYVRAYQKRMFNNRTVGALSLMSVFFGAGTLIKSIPASIEDTPLPMVFLLMGFGLFKFYRSLSPPPEKPFTHFF
ncbi:MAG: hypothetical protein VYD50_03125 [Candidatus Thermoplasmatota archaeon]|nr:hypothetical protein [Candidatus Thermoplasmatota archaeon]